MSVIFVSMLLSGAMPVALFSAALWFVTSYWCDKAELLKLSRRPVIYGNALSDHVMNLLPYAAVSIIVHWHCHGSTLTVVDDAALSRTRISHPISQAA